MIYNIPHGTALWEVMAAAQIAQAKKDLAFSCTGEAAALLECAGVTVDTTSDPPYFNFSYAYRALEDSQEPYVGVLASANGMVGLEIGMPQFSGIKPLPNSGIVVCPYPTKKEMALPETVWRGVMHYLRGFNKRIYLLSGRGQWMDACGFSEDEILSEHSISEKLSILAGADLVVGTPNEWFWAGTYWQKKMIYFYPDDVPQKRWFHIAHSNYGRAVYRASAIQIPVILNQLRLLLGIMTEA